MPSNPKKYFCSGLKKIHTREMRHVKKVVSNSPGLVDFAFGLVNFVLKVSVKENEVPTEKNSSRASIFATKASYISN